MTIELNGHTIKKTEIVGIGPLMLERSLDPVLSSLYAPIRYFYTLHLRNQSVRIKSPWYDRQGRSPEDLETNKSEYSNWEKGYWTAKKAIIDAINSDIP
jgi:hypothetical protein